MTNGTSGNCPRIAAEPLALLAIIGHVDDLDVVRQGAADLDGLDHRLGSGSAPGSPPAHVAWRAEHDAGLDRELCGGVGVLPLDEQHHAHDDGDDDRHQQREGALD